MTDVIQIWMTFVTRILDEICHPNLNGTHIHESLVTSLSASSSSRYRDGDSGKRYKRVLKFLYVLSPPEMQCDSLDIFYICISIFLKNRKDSARKINPCSEKSVWIMI